MKFLCDNCKAKYQIPDEKIAGRTLRMTCRRCSHDIIIRGEQAAKPRAGVRKPRPARGGSSAGPMPRRTRGGSSVGPAPRATKGSALGADFRRQAMAPAPAPAPAPPAAVHEWHVSINDVPVGPIKRDELARKVGTGAVHAETLAWREGFDDWRPVKNIPELMALIRQRRAPAPPPPAAAPRTARRTSSSTGIPRQAEPTGERTGRNNVIPIGGRLGAAAAPAPPAPEPIPAPVFAPVPGPAPADDGLPADLSLPAALSAPGADLAAAPLSASSAAPAARAGIPVGAWIAIAGAGAFGIALAFMVMARMFSSEPAPVASNQTTPEVEAPTPVADLTLTAPIAEPTPEPIAEPGEPGETEPGETEPAAPSESPTAMRRSGAPRPAGAGTGTGTMRSKTKQMSAEERELLARFGGGTGAAPSKIRGVTGIEESGPRREPLDATQLSRVVSANRPGLQRCYDRAIRGRGEPPSVRMDIQLRVASSGRVTRASASGNDFGGLKSCLEASVRRWRFPASSAGAETRFPIVFSGG